MSKIDEMNREKWILSSFPEWGTWLNEEIDEEVVEKGKLAMWWLGCVGIWFKTENNTNIVIDAWFGNGKRTKKVQEMAPFHQMRNMTGGKMLQPNLRGSQIVFDPYAVTTVDAVLSTHYHADHIDLNMAAGVLQNVKAKVPFIGPKKSVEIWRKWGVPEDQLVTVKPGDVIKIKDYNVKMAEGREADFVKLGVSMKLVKSLANILMIDQDAEWEQKEMAFSGITGVLNDSRIDVSASTGIPLMEMFGQGAGGFASGEEDKKNKYEMINARQESQLRPAWNFIDQFMIDKFKEEDETFKLDFFDYDFPSIRDRNEKEEAEIAKIIIDSLKVLYDMDAVDAVQVASEVKLKGLIASISDADIEALKAVINDPAYEKNTGGSFF